MNTTSLLTLFFARRNTFSLTQKFLMAVGFACLTGFMAQIRIPLPWTPVPITGQTLAVLTSGAILGTWWGGISQVVYVILGIAGLPWFSNGGSGLAWLIGPTGGYLIGFVLNAFFIGFIIDAYPKIRTFKRLLPLMFIANLFFVHGVGLTQLNLWLSLVQHTPKTFWELLLMGFIPFIVGDTIKIVAAATIISGK